MSDQVKMLLGLAARRSFTLLGAWLASKGLIQGDTSGFVGACMVLAEVGYEGWNRYGTVLVNAQLAKMRGVHPSQNPIVPNSPGVKSGGGIGNALIFAVAISALFLAMPAIAADVAPKVVTKAPPPAVPFAYPSADGWYGIVGSAGGGGTASVSAPGVNANSLITNSASVYLGVGYQWSIPNSPAFSALEGKVGYTNLNGAAPGLSFQGPVDFHARWLIGVPLDQIAKFIPNWGIQMPTTAPLPTGVTAVSQRFYMAPGFHVSDDSLSFMGKSSGTVWGWAPSFTPAGLQVALSNGGMLDAYTEIRVNTNGLCTNSAFGRACGRANTEVLAGVDYKFGIGLPK